MQNNSYKQWNEFGHIKLWVNPEYLCVGEEILDLYLQANIIIFKATRIQSRTYQGLCPSGMLRGVIWQLFTDVSTQSIGPIFKDQAADN
jgi:hypothetical protein